MIQAGLAASMLALALVGGAARAADLCAERPGQTTPPCIVAGGNILLETAIVDWSFEREQGSRTDTFLIADTVARIGIGGASEVQIGWTPLGFERERDGAVTHRTRSGDATIAFKHGLTGDDGPVAVTVRATLPVGRDPIGDGDWGAAVLIPAELPISDK